MLTSFLLFFFILGSFYYTSRAGFYVWGVSLTHPMLALYLSREFLMHIPFWLHFYLVSFSYTSHACFNFLWGISYTSHVGFKKIYNSGEFLLHIPCWLHFYAGSFADSSRTGFISIWGVSLTHPILALFFSWAGWVGRGSYTGEFLLHIPCWGCLFFVCLFLNLGSFSYRSRAGFVFMRGVSLTHPVLALFFFI